MTNKSDVEVVKLPNDRKKSTQSRDFAPMPQLYLELLENKDKIKPTLINKDYDPENASQISETLSVGKSSSIIRPSTQSRRVRSGPFLKPIPRESDEEEESDEEDEEEDSEEDSEEEDSDEDEEEDDDEGDEEDEEDDEDDDGEEEEDEDDDESNNESRHRDRQQKQSGMNGIATNEITNRLYNILSEERPKENYEAPRLSDLEQSGQIRRDKQIPDFTNGFQQNGFQHPLSEEEQDDMKRDILFKFELLKKSYKNVPIEIPEFTMHSDFDNMKRAYESTLRRVSLDSNVESYKSYLIGGFMVMEFILGHWLKFDMQGFTQQQILNMGSYERLLIELGEKNYIPQGSEWPVELRLLFMIIINAGVFIVSKMIMKRTGTNFMSMMNSMNEFHKSTTSEFPKRKMRGPNIDVTNMPDL